MTAFARLAVHRLTLTDFRCYAALRLETDSRPVVLTGPNGAGKTNILEALSFLAPGRGLRRAKLSEATRQGAGPRASWAVAVVLDVNGEPVSIGTGREAETERRLVRIDGKAARPGNLTDRLSVLWLTPAMDRLFVEGAVGRRRFLDRLVHGLEPAHATHATAYDHAMRERTRLLRSGGRDRVWLSTLEEAMARHGTAMATARRDVLAALDRACGERVGPFPAARLTLGGDSLARLGEDDGGEAMEHRLRAAFETNRERDAAAGAATAGPHRVDLEVAHADKNVPAGLCSTGEQKAVLVRIVLAQARVRTLRHGQAPLLLLDEVAAHLDEDRRAALFDELSGLSAQSWMTGTDAHLFAGFQDRAQFVRVTDATAALNAEGDTT